MDLYFFLGIFILFIKTGGTLVYFFLSRLIGSISEFVFDLFFKGKIFLLSILSGELLLDFCSKADFI